MPGYLIGESPAIKRIKASLTKYSSDTSPLVITGEPGVGKSLLSARIHAHSLLKDHELESINFEILSERDQRIRLLGGSPPDLPTTRRSTLELPTTVVLKHIDCASRFLQEHLVEAILKKEIIRLGTNQRRPVRCRLIFILHGHPQKLFKTGFIIPGLSKILTRYQIIHMPTVKERKEDVPELAQHFFTQSQIKRRKRLDQKLVELLLKHKWEMNVLELKAFIKTLDVPPDEVAIQQKNNIELAMMNLMVDEGKEFSVKRSVARIESRVIQEAQKKYRNCQVETAHALGMSEFNVRHILKRSH